MLFSHLLTFFKVNFFKKIISGNYQNVKRFQSRSGPTEYQDRQRERSGSVVECLTRDRGAAGLGVTALDTFILA